MSTDGLVIACGSASTKSISTYDRHVLRVPLVPSARVHPVLKEVAVAFAIVLAGCSPGATPHDVPQAGWSLAQVDTLLRLGSEDQDGRLELGSAIARQDTAVAFASMRADSARTRWVRAAVTQNGWPMRARVGDSASKAAWLILQHSPDTAWQAAMAPQLERLGRAGEFPRPDVALLIDRVLVNAGHPQRFGSQFHLENGRLVPAPVENLARLDEQRAGMGLPPMAEYVKMLAELMKLPVTWPPER